MVFLIACDKAQAGICLDYVRGLLAPFPDIVEKDLRDELWLKNRVTIAVKTCSFRASRGFSTAIVICDELAFWRDEASANPAEEVINSLLPGLLPGGLLLGISTPYAKFGYLYEMYESDFGKPDSDVLIWKAGTKTMNPLYSQVTIDRLMKRDRVAFGAEYAGEFREDVEAFLPEVLIKSAMTQKNHNPPQAGQRYAAFIDPSGGRSDSMTLAIGHQEGDVIAIDFLDERHPPFDPAVVSKEFCDYLKFYGVDRAVSDRYAGVWVSSAFEKHGIRVEMSDAPASEIYLTFQALLSMKKVQLVDDPVLLRQLKQLERRTRSGGKDLITHPDGLHDDVANAVAGVAVHLSKQRIWTPEDLEKMMPRRIEKPDLFRREDPKLAEAESEMQKFIGGNRIVRH